MNIDDVKEWIEIADNDFDSAILLNEAVRKHHEIICYHCSQAVEKYLKGYLVSMNIVPKKTHDLRFLNSLCIELDNNTVKKIRDFKPINNLRNSVNNEIKKNLTT
jgi:HEPN domain-containing protein